MSSTAKRSLQVRTFQRIQSLSQRITRDRQQCYWIEGIRNFIHAFESGCRFEAVVHCPVLLKSVVVEKMLRQQIPGHTARLRVTPQDFRSLLNGARASGIGAIVRQRWHRLEQLDPHGGLCWLIVEQIRSPGNLGSLLRTAAAVDVAGVICIGNQTDPFDPAVVRASMGALWKLPLLRTSATRFREWVRQYAIQVVGLNPAASTEWTQLAVTAPCAIAVGEERQGLTPLLQALCETTVSLPMSNQIDSLNVTVATSIMLYELLRQRRGSRS